MTSTVFIIIKKSAINPIYLKNSFRNKENLLFFIVLFINLKQILITLNIMNLNTKFTIEIIINPYIIKIGRAHV